MNAPKIIDRNAKIIGYSVTCWIIEYDGYLIHFDNTSFSADDLFDTFRFGGIFYTVIQKIKGGKIVYKISDEHTFPKYPK